MDERFSASVAGRHMACPASAHLDRAIPNWTPPVVDDMAGAKGAGTRKHAMLEPIMELSATEIEQMRDVLTYMAELRRRRVFKVLVEEKVTATWLIGQPKTTADVVLFVADEIHVVDFKWGKISVPVLGNEQLLFYAACYAGLAPKAKGVTVHILQPPAKQMDHWFITQPVLAQFMRDAQAAEKKIIAGDTTFGPSDHCKFCPANPHSRSDKGRPLCPAMMKLLGYGNAVNEDEILGLA